MRALIVCLLAATGCSAQLWNAADVNAGPFTTVLAPGSRAVLNYGAAAATSATVSFLPVGTTTPVPSQVILVDSFRITFVIPETLPLGPAQLIYKAGDQPTKWMAVTIAASSFSLFRSGIPGPLIAVNFSPSGSNQNSLETPARDGQFMILYGSGLGATPQSAVAITLGGVPQPVQYAGPAPNMPGLDQINFQIVPGTPNGCYVPLVFQAGNQIVNSFLSKTPDGSACAHSLGLTLATMAALDSKATTPIDEAILRSSLDAPAADRASRNESVEVQRTGMDASRLASLFVPPPLNASCSIATGTAAAFAFAAIFQVSAPLFVLANDTDTIPVPWTSQQDDAPLSSLPASVLAGRAWTLKSAAGSSSFTLPPAVQIADTAPVTIERAKARTITWDGLGYDSTAIAFISLTGSGFAAPTVSCAVSALSGSITLAPELLSQFTAGSAGVLTLSVNQNTAGVPAATPTARNVVTVPLVVEWTSSDVRPVDFK